MATPFFDLIQELDALGGAPKVTYPYGDIAYPTTERKIKALRGSHLLAYGTPEPDSVKFPNNKLSRQIELRMDGQFVEVYRKYDITPGPPLIGTKDTDWGPETTTSQLVVYGTAAPNTQTTTEASVVPSDELQANLQSSTCTLPGPYLYATEIDPDTNIKVRVKTRRVANGTDGGIFAPPTTAIASASIASATVITLSAPMVIAGQELVTIAGDTNTTPSINGQWPATVIDSTHFSIPVNVTAVAGSGFGTVRLAALFYTEIQKLNDRQSIEVTSQVDTSTLAQATKVWTGYIEYPWKEVLVGLDPFSDAGIDTSSLAGTFPVPTQLTWVFGANIDNDVAIRTARYTGKTFATITRSYSLGAPTPDTVLQIRTSSGELMMTGAADSTHVAISIGTSSTGTQTSNSQSIKRKSARVEDVLTGSFATGSSIGTGIVLKLNASSPATFTAGATFIGSSEINPGRLGLFLKETTQITVPTPFPL